MVDDLGTVGIGVKYALFAAVPNQTDGFISYIALITVEHFWNKRWRLQFISSLNQAVLRKTIHELHPPKPNEFFSTNS